MTKHVYYYLKRCYFSQKQQGTCQSAHPLSSGGQFVYPLDSRLQKLKYSHETNTFVRF